MVEELIDFVYRTRQHHAIEHATLQVMGQQTRGKHARDHALSGYSDPFGFTIFGETDEESIRRGVGNALLRLQAGETTLAIHPNCGTNLVATGLLITLAALFTSRKSNPVERFAVTLLAVLPMLIAGKALGMMLQRYTTCADVSDRWVTEIFPVKFGQIRAYRVSFE